ncbi:hypothetical protein DERP_007385, partial [Dermatophagoides pteronyssinus]
GTPNIVRKFVEQFWSCNLPLVSGFEPWTTTIVTNIRKLFRHKPTQCLSCLTKLVKSHYNYNDSIN